MGCVGFVEIMGIGMGIGNGVISTGFSIVNN